MDQVVTVPINAQGRGAGGNRRLDIHQRADSVPGETGAPAMTTGREPQLGGQPQGNEPMLGGEDKDYIIVRCHNCDKIIKTIKESQAPDKALLESAVCYRCSLAMLPEHERRYLLGLRLQQRPPDDHYPYFGSIYP
jgi:hypothetical protein